MRNKPITKAKQVSLRDIAWTFLQIGAVSFSLAALGEAKNWLVKRKGWFTEEEYLQGVGFSQLLPGAPVVSLMAYCGYQLRGVLGSATAVIANLMPPFILMLLFTYLYAEYHHLTVISSLFKGLGALVVGLVINTVLGLWKSGVNTKQNWFLALGGFCLVYWLQLSIYGIFLLATTLSIIFMLLSRRWSWWARVMAGIKDNTFKEDIKLQQIDWLKYRITLLIIGTVFVGNIILINTSETFYNLGITLMQLGGLVFGSGYAMLPFLQKEAIDTYQWVSGSEFTAAVALSLVLPGPVTKVATFIGYKAAGLMGAVVATINIYLPTFCIINLTADFYRRANQVVMIRLVVRGIVAAFIGTLWAVVIRLAETNLVDAGTIMMAAGIVLAQRFTNINTLKIVLIGALISVVVF